MKYFLALLFLAFTACGHDVSANNFTPFPPIPPTGGTITLEPGVYDCPASIPTSTHIIGHGAIMGEEIYSIGQPVHKIGTIATVRVLCNHTLTLRSVADVQISGVIFDFSGTSGPGLVLDSVTYSRFDIGVQHVVNGPGVRFLTSDGNVLGNNFEHLEVWDCFQGLHFKGGGNFVVTWNLFHDVKVLKSTDYGIGIESQTDTNIFDSVRVAFLAANARAGVLINTQGTASDVDTGGNIFHALMVDSIDPANFTGHGVDFHGFTMGNKVTVTFGLIPENSKVFFAPGFTHTDAVDKLTEH